MYDEKYDGKDIPKFLVGHSMGGFISTTMVAERPDQYYGMSLVAPFFKLYDPSMILKFVPVAKIIKNFIPNYQF